MATATATAEVVPARTSRWTYLLAYLALVIVAEILIAVPGGATGQDRPLQPIGLAMHILLVFSLMFLSVLLQPKDAPLANLLVAVSLASLVRVFSLAVPRFAFLATPESNVYNTIPWLGLVSVPLLVSVAAVAYVQGLRPRALGGTHLPRDPVEAGGRSPRRTLRAPLRDRDLREPPPLFPERHRYGLRLRGRPVLWVRRAEHEQPLGRHLEPQPRKCNPIPGRAVPLGPWTFREALAVPTGPELEHFDDLHRDDEGEHDEEWGDRDEQGVGEDPRLQASRLLRVGAREFPHDEKQDQGRDRGGAEAPREKRRRDCHYSRDHCGPSALLLDNDVRTYLNAFPTRRFFENGNVRLWEEGFAVSAFEVPRRRPRARTRSGQRTIRPRPSCIRSPGSGPCSSDGWSARSRWPRGASCQRGRG